jgi:hypothetical protein
LIILKFAAPPSANDPSGADEAGAVLGKDKI